LVFTLTVGSYEFIHTGFQGPAAVKLKT